MPHCPRGPNHSSRCLTRRNYVASAVLALASEKRFDSVKSNKTAGWPDLKRMRIRVAFPRPQ
ncbi:hypothetical protein RB12693 [Rhodopirellula baltica SH 1]|uniref:Uncharacterized protein n=1 Tax=Rhodopirellula baltica (strain DSM 10527 / NCIMB 13988 / SH1) TaxID=243090 RepID=Q7UI83_RHOBA|nr:hypothetical protein RB12693 [Rhodopirellula baltica SH 1]